MAKVIAVVQLKGGCGRSTISTTLAGELSKRGSVVLIDADPPQYTASSWYAVRQSAGLCQPANDLHCYLAEDHRALVQLVKQHSDADFIIMDGAPRLHEASRAALVLADLCLTPSDATCADLWATGDLAELVREAREVAVVDIRLVWNKDGKLRGAHQLRAAADSDIGIKALQTTLGLSIAYGQALRTGRTAAELKGANVREEVEALVDEVVCLLEHQ